MQNSTMPEFGKSSNQYPPTGTFPRNTSPADHNPVTYNATTNFSSMPNMTENISMSHTTPGIDPSQIPAEQLKPNKAPNAKKVHTYDAYQKLIFLCIGLGVFALVATTVAIWAIANRSSKTTATNYTETTTSTTVIDDAQTAKVLGFYPNKITNPTEDVIYRLGSHRNNSDGKAVIGAYINTENTAAEIYVYWEYVSNYYGVATDRKDRELFTIEFNKKVADITIAESGQSRKGDTILIMLSDGTIQYIPIVKSLEEGAFQASSQLAGITDVVKFYHTDAVSDTGDFSGYSTTLAQRADGSIIDLQSFLISATN